MSRYMQLRTSLDALQANPAKTLARELAQVLTGDCLAVMRQMMEDGVQVDAVVTDPPAGISFMGKEWDHHKGGRDQWIAWMQEAAALALQLSKPGAHALVWALPRTSHWTATAWEDAGWEVRDRVAHLFGTGFPKSRDISKAIDAEAGAEREVVSIERSCFTVRPENAVSWKSGSGGGDSRPRDESGYRYDVVTVPATDAARQWEGWGTALKPACEDWWLLRKPLQGIVAGNVLEHGTGALNIDGCRVSTGRWPANVIHSGLSEEWAQYFYCAKAGRSERWKHVVCSCLAQVIPPGHVVYDLKHCPLCGDEFKVTAHPTQKPESLMRFLCRLITPPDGTILDPFCGSGSTGRGAVLEGFDFVGIEQDPAHADVARLRIQAALDKRLGSLGRVSHER